MTRETAIKGLKAFRREFSGYEPNEEMFDMAIKALEQEPVIDKIRADIEKLRPNLRPEQMTDYDYAMVEVVDDIVAIIDKYKADRSVEE